MSRLTLVSSQLNEYMYGLANTSSSLANATHSTVQKKDSQNFEIKTASATSTSRLKLHKRNAPL